MFEEVKLSRLDHLMINLDNSLSKPREIPTPPHEGTCKTVSSE